MMLAMRMAGGSLDDRLRNLNCRILILVLIVGRFAMCSIMVVGVLAS
jgi:hypothetical protein